MKSKTLENISFQIKKGENIAIVGENGAGKTTLIKLLCGLYTAGEGQILINGENAADYKNEEYFDLFSPVFQDYSFLPLSIAQNVAAKTEYDKSKVAAALKDAGIYDKIQSFAHGMDTKLIKEVNRDAQDLSGGEKQKLLLAKAIYKNAPVVVLDEPTAALDPVAENEVYQRFNTFVKGKTAIYISHRLSSCVFYNRIAVFHDAQLVQTGTHKELLASGGKYAQLWHAQAEYYLN